MEFSSALVSLNATIELIKAAISTRDDFKLNAALGELGQKYVDLSMTAIQITEKIGALNASLHAAQDENAELRKKLDERARYALAEITPGKFAYKFIALPGSVEPIHYLCQVCYDQGVKSVLHFHRGSNWSPDHCRCNNSKDRSHDVY